MRDIENFIKFIQPTFGDIKVYEYFIESSYVDARNRTYRQYLLTKKGCEFYASKMTGEQGTIFSIKYVDKFNEMEQQQPKVMDSYMIENPIERAKRWIEEQEERERLANIVEEQKPKVEYHDTVLNCDKLLSVTDIANDLGISATRLNRILEEKEIQYRDKSKKWKIHSEYYYLVKEGYCDYHITEYGQQLKWTEKGRQWILEQVKYDI